MARSLKEFYRYEDNLIGLPSKTDGPQKLIRSPNTGQRFVVPGYEEDFIFQQDRRKVDFDINKQVSSNWNWERFNNRIIHKVDRSQPATPFVLRPPKQVREI